MSETEIVFNGPPPVTKNGGALRELKRLLDERPGEWANFTLSNSRYAASRAQYLRKLGYESTSRGESVYARKPVA